MRIRSMLVGAAALLFAFPATALGQVNFGPQLSWGGDTDVGVGGRIVAGIESVPRWDFIGSFDIFFPDGFDYWEANGNVAYNFTIEEAETIYPYVGGGLNLAHISPEGLGNGGSDTELGLNLFGGTQFEGESIIPYLEVRLVIEAAEQVVLTGGVLF